ncbi:hypothetical protein ACFLYN_05405 [Chloroflexota bacterium]
MAIDGTYKVDVTTVMGTEHIEFTFKTEGNSVGGTIDGLFGFQSFAGGTIDGNDVLISTIIEAPVGQMELNIGATIEGDKITGQIQLGSFRPSVFEGSRV